MDDEDWYEAIFDKSMQRDVVASTRIESRNLSCYLIIKSTYRREILKALSSDLTFVGW